MNKIDPKRQLNSLVSLAKRAGKLVFGEEKCEKCIKTGEAQLIFVAVDASVNTKKKFNNKSNFYNIPLYESFSKDTFEMLTGMQNRAVAVITDINFANRIIQLIDIVNGGG